MALYDYRCQQCGNITEVWHLMSELPLNRHCPNCSGPLKRIITETPHVKLAWKAYDRADHGHDRMVIPAAKQGKPSPLGDRAQRGQVKVHDDPNQA